MSTYRSIIIIATTIVATVFTTSCYKERGCTDPDSVNFSMTAEIDDGSCTYEGSVVFWYGETTSADLLYYGITSLTYYVEGIIVGSSAANIYWGGDIGPDCGLTGSVTVTKDLGPLKYKQYPYNVRDQYNTIIWEGVLDINANTCLQYELASSKKMLLERPERNQDNVELRRAP